MKIVYFIFLFVFILTKCFSQNVLINKVYNSGLNGGNADAIELITVGAHPLSTIDLRGMTIKNYSSNGTVDAGCYTFKPHALWANLKSGTIIVLRRNTTSTDINTSDNNDFKLDVNLDDATYFTAGSIAMNIASIDMVVIKYSGSNASGETGAIHAVSFGNPNPTANYNNVTSSKLITTNSIGTGSYAYVLNDKGSIADFNNNILNVAEAPNADITAGGISLGNPTILGNGSSNNLRFLNILRPSVVIESVYNSGLANGLGDVIKLKVLGATNLDMRGMFIKDFRTNGSVSNIYYKFSDASNSIWQNVPSGTVITLTRAVAGVSSDLNSSDFTLDVLLPNIVSGNNTEFNATNSDVANSIFFDLEDNDMLVLQPAGNIILTSEDVISHAMAFGVVFSNGSSKYASIGFGPKVGIGNSLSSDSKISVQNTFAPINYYNSNLAIAYSVLPVQLFSFTAKKQLSTISLKWSTLTESNNAKYEIYRASNGVNFIKIATLLGAGTSSSPQYYSYIDNTPEAGDNYYKLVQVDNDGKEKVLKILVVNNNIETINAQINKANLIISSFSSKNQKAEILLTDASGQIICNQTVFFNYGPNNFIFDLIKDAPLYILSVKLDDDVVVKKLFNSAF